MILNVLYNVKKNSRCRAWHTWSPNEMFLYFSFQRHLQTFSRVWPVVAISKYTKRTTSAALPRRIQDNPPFVKFYFPLGTGGACYLFIKKVLLRIYFISVESLWIRGKSEVLRHFLLSPIRLRSAVTWYLGVFENYRPHFLILSSTCKSCYCTD